MPLGQYFLLEKGIQEEFEVFKVFQKNAITLGRGRVEFHPPYPSISMVNRITLFKKEFICILGI